MTISAGNKILITGAPGVGKTTLIRRLVSELGSVRCAGFTTVEIRAGGVRKGFELVSLDGRKAILAHVDFRSSHKVGRYGVDVAGFDRFLDAIDLAQSDADLLVIDEIGKMEMMSEKFRRLMAAVFSYEQPLIATIASAGPAAIQRFKKHRKAVLFEVTRSNRQKLAAEITAWLARR